MTVKEKRELRRNLKREKIIDTASGLFSRKGYHEVMMEDVARLTSVAKGTVYNYFSSKEELYFSIMRQRMEKLMDSLTNKVKREVSSIDSLRSFVIHLYMFMMKYQNFFLMYRKETLKTDNEICFELQDLENQLRDLLSGIIGSGKEEALFRDVDNDFAVNIILGSIYGAVQRGIDKNYSEEEITKEKDTVFEFVLYGLYSDKRSMEILPLKNKTIVITRTVEQSAESSQLFIRLGANVIVFPTLEIVPPSSWQQFDEIVTGSNRIDYIIFTSAHAVSMFKKRYDELNAIIDFEKIKVLAVGSKTANVCKELGLPVHIIPPKFSGEAVVAELSKYSLKDKVVFIPRSAIGREVLPNGLKELGAIIKPVPVYNVALPADENIKAPLEKLRKSKPDLFIFTSPSTFENFMRILNITDPIRYFTGYEIAAIGPTTKSAIEERKVKVDIMPDEFTIEGLAKAIVDYYKINNLFKRTIL